MEIATIPTMIKTAIVILNFNGKAYLEKFLPSIVEYSMIESTEIYVADNASSDDSLDFLSNNYPNIKTIVLDKNYGFAGGYNQCLQKVDAEYFVLLNSDVEVSENWINPIINFMDNHQQVAACQPKILAYHQKNQFEHAGAAGGYIDKYGYPFCRGRIFDTCEIDKGQYNGPKEIFWASGACLFIRKNEFFNAGGFDDTFFAHMEEIDLCWRLKARNKSIMCIPESKVYHVGGGTLSVESPRKTYLNFRNNLLMLYKNLPEEKLKGIISTRLLLDFLAAAQFLLKGKIKNIISIWNAHQDFFEMRKGLKEKRATNISSTKTYKPSGLLDKSIISLYFLHGKKKFNDIRDLIY